MGWLLDTNVLSELRKGKRANDGVRKWFAGVDGAELHTSVLVLGEIRRGIELIGRRDDVAAQALDQWLLRTLETFTDHVLPVDERIANRWGQLNVPNPVPTIDGLLAATAIEHDLTFVTRNSRDVDTTGVTVLNPFETT
jgi:predicted nucleic acid-binding protein